MRHIFVPNKNSFSPLNCEDRVLETKVRAGDEVWISVVFTWDKPLAESMGAYYRSIGAEVKLGGPAYDDPGGEFTPGLFSAPGVVITSRGCPRGCPWCYVPKREGQRIRHLDVKEGRILQDNNILACNREHKERVWAMLRRQRAISLRGGLDARLLKDEDVDNIRSLKLFDLWTAYDDKENRTASLSAIRRLRAAGIPQHKIRCYVLIGFAGETRREAEGRLWDCAASGALPFAQLYDGYTGSEEETLEWKRLARRWSRPPITKAEIARLDRENLKGLI
jgi:hypothetical protein